jgi:hypothetical protein
MPVAYDVLVLYGALAVWVALLAYGFRRRRFWPFAVFGICLMAVLNVRYFVEGPPGAIAFFVGIYDVFDNVGLAADEGAPALAQCVDNACTVWGDRYLYHPAWGVAFYDRFIDGPALRTNLLYGHIFFNSIAFALMHVQLARPGIGARRRRHRLLGYISFSSLTLGTVCATWLASEHGAVEEYGAAAAELGFYSMSAIVYLTAVAGILAARRGNADRHRRWMIRHIGAMWGAFWLFRVMLVVTGPLLRNQETASLLLSIWLSAPLGVLLAEYLFRRHQAAKVEEARMVLTA